MPKLKPLRKAEDLAAVPLDQPVLVDLEPEGAAVDVKPANVDDTSAPAVADDGADAGVNVLKEQLEALKKANAEELKRERDQRIAAERKAEQSERERVAAVNSQSATEVDAVQSGLAAAQAEMVAAELALKAAGEVGDWDAIAKAQARIGRTAADIRDFERSAAVLAERKTAEPERKSAQSPSLDVNTAIDGNPQLLDSERIWLKAHPEAIIDPSRNKELDVAYIKATRKGLVRGAADYFKFIEQEMGYATPAVINTEDNDMPVQAPVSRNDRGSDGRPTDGKIMLSPAQREIAKNMGLTDTEYARQVAAFDVARKADPEKYR